MAIWQIQSNTELPADLLEMAGADSLLARLLWNRSVVNTDMDKYFLALDQVVESSPLEIPQMTEAFSRIKKAIEAQQKIFIYGDYDVDGTSSVALLVRAFALIGVAVHYYVPSRHHDNRYPPSHSADSVSRVPPSRVLNCSIGNLTEDSFSCSSRSSTTTRQASFFS